MILDIIVAASGGLLGGVPAFFLLRPPRPPEQEDAPARTPREVEKRPARVIEAEPIGYGVTSTTPPGGAPYPVAPPPTHRPLPVFGPPPWPAAGGITEERTPSPFDRIVAQRDSAHARITQLWKENLALLNRNADLERKARAATRALEDQARCRALLHQMDEADTTGLTPGEQTLVHLHRGLLADALKAEAIEVNTLCESRPRIIRSYP